MPASFLAELVLETLGQLVLGLATDGAEAGVRAVAGSGKDAAAEDRARALAMVDIVVLAACYDFVVTEAERQELARRTQDLFGRAELDVSIDELLQRWQGPRQALHSDTAFLAAIRSLADELSASESRRVFDATVAVLSAGGEAETPEGAPYRRPSTKEPAEAIALFGEALGMAEGAIAAAVARVRPPED